MSKHNTKCGRVIAGAALAACLGLTGRAHAAQCTWTGGGGSLNTGWNINANWTGGAKPVSDQTTKVVFGPGAADNFQDISIPLTMHWLQFAPGSSDNVGGFPLDLCADPGAGQLTGYIENLSTLTNTVHNNLTLSSYLYVLGSNGSGPIDLSGNIGGANTIGASNHGVLRLSGNNTFSGGVQLSYGGELQVTNNASLGTGTLAMDPSTSVRAYGAPVTLPNPITFGNVGTYSFRGDKDITFNGAANIWGGGPKYFDVAPGITARFNGVISGNPIVALLNKTGDGTLTLGGNNTFAGSLNVAAGTLAIAGQDVLPLNADVTVQSGAALNLGTSGNGNSSFASKPIHSLTVNGGLVRVPNSSGDYWLNQLALTGGSVDMTGSNVFWLHFTGGTPKLTTNPSGQTATIGSPGALPPGNPGGLGELRNNSADDVTLTVGAGTTASGVDLDLNTRLESGIGGGAFYKNGAGVVRLSAAGSTAHLKISAGTVRFDDPAALTSGTIDIGGGILQYGGGAGSAAINQRPTVFSGWVDVPDPLATANFVNGFAGNGSLEKIGAGTLALPNVRQAILRLDKGTVRVTPDGTAAGTSNTDLLIGIGARLDLTDNDLVTSTNGFYTFAEIGGLIKSGYANGSWAGSGITSSSAAAAVGSQHPTALGYARSVDLGISTFSGQNVGSTSVVVRYTLAGDSNLDGTVDLTDFTYLAGNFNGTGKDWLHGDYNYDGNVDLTDFTYLAANFNQTLPGALPAGGGSLGSSVPEPTLIIPFALVLAFGATRMRRRIPMRSIA